MTMQALNHLVARSIVDPLVVQAYSAGRIGDLLVELDFPQEVRAQLAEIQADTFAEYAVLAYRLVKAADRATVRIVLPSPLEGLLPETGEERAKREQVA
ncbi:MAG TPA: hypothetical protein VJ123_07430 [Anaerolineales bacterium]|nr:hypothetical protein [Anaerolineales bacterium]